MSWKTSHYTRFIDLEGGEGLLYNGRSGAVLKLSASPMARCRSIMQSVPAGQPISPEHEDEPLFKHLLAGGYVVEHDLDEVAAIEEQYYRTREHSAFLLTILPTFGCNLGCSYCFVGKKRGFMNKTRQDQIIAFVRDKFETRDIPKMSVDWFGGEPLLALPAIDYLSKAFLDLCKKYDTPYSAQAITNGTVITDEVVEVMQRSKIERLQITLDGLRVTHDERRPGKSAAIASFDQTIRGLDKVVGKFVVRLRINVDKRNLHEAWGLLDFFEERGWLGPDTRFYPYLARISPFTEACSSVATEVCSVDEFERVNMQWITRLHALGVPVLFQGLYQFPEPKLYNCGAIGPNGYIFNPNGEVHKCGLAVDDSSEAIGMLGQELDIYNPNAQKWRAWNPVTNPVCRGCEHLPTCLGGCPRNQMEMREVQKKENCEFYHEHQNRILKTHMALAEL